MGQITTISLFKYRGFRDKLWGFGMMQFAHQHLAKVKGLEFYKLWGSGKANFNPWPDWSTYALLQVWEDEAAAEQFYAQAPLMKRYRDHAHECWTLFMRNEKSRGAWSGKNPFRSSDALDGANPFIIAITRATIKTKMLIPFWKYVPKSQNGLSANAGLLYTKGFGELPIKNMATFSVWSDRKYLDAFAYQQNAHVGAIQQTRKLNWYTEELFSRFQPYRSVGTWGGKNPLPQLETDQKEIDKK